MYVHAIRATYAEPTQIRSYVRIAAKSHPRSLRPSNSLSLSLSLLFTHATKFPLMSNSRIDDFHFVLFLSLFSLSSLYCIHDYCICAIAVVGRFEFPRICAEEKKKKSGRKRRSAHLSILRHGSNVPLLIRKKDSHKKRVCALACLPVRN